jgi:hypothetical protein
MDKIVSDSLLLKWYCQPQGVDNDADESGGQLAEETAAMSRLISQSSTGLSFMSLIW